MATKKELMDKTNAELRQMCKNLGIVGMTKKRKEIIVKALLANQKANTDAKAAKASDQPATIAKPKAKPAEQAPLTSMAYQMQSTLSKPSAKVGDKCTTTLMVSCGANSGSFPVAGRKVGEVKGFLKEALNIPSFPDAVVNGKKVEDKYVLTEKDTLEFLKPAGRKG